MKSFVLFLTVVGNALAFAPVARFSTRLSPPLAIAPSHVVVGPHATPTMGIDHPSSQSKRGKRATVAHFLRKRMPKPALAVILALSMRGAPARASDVAAAPSAPPSESTWQAPNGEYRPRYESAAAKKAKKGDKAQLVIGGGLFIGTIVRMQASGADAQKREKVRIQTTLENMQLQQQEFMDVQGEARSDQDMFASLRERSADLEDDDEPEMEQEDGAVLTATATDDEEGEVGGGGGGGDSFDSFLSGGENAAGAAGAAPAAEEDEAAQADAGPTLASSSDVDMLRRMFGEAATDDAEE